MRLFKLIGSLPEILALIRRASSIIKNMEPTPEVLELRGIVARIKELL